MASCLGPDGGSASFKRVCLAIANGVLVSGLTAFLVVRVFLPRELSSDGIDPADVDPLVYLTIVLVVSPLCWGFYALFSHLLKRWALPGIPVILSSLSSALVAVYLLPGLFLFLFIGILSLLGYLLQ